MSEVDKLHDELERQRELIAALRNEVATWKNGFNSANEALRFAAARVAELEAAQADGRTYAEGCKP